ncbi:MAG TPA: Mut7-C RNAse domain-containing protein [Methylomirabilota bacterium]|nr:Mut7-C RNAse domain-containing protein [Methylomirabilota bacterium]
MTHSRFIVDTMLGRLARWLRAMGYDTLYPGQAEDRRLLQLARFEDRTVVTRDRMLARLAAPRSCLVRAELVDAQIVEVVERLALTPRDEDWLSRCLECNAPLEARGHAQVAGLVPAHVLVTQARFMACPGCGRIYWAGSHADRMLERLARLLRGH